MYSKECGTERERQSSGDTSTSMKIPTAIERARTRERGEIELAREAKRAHFAFHEIFSNERHHGGGISSLVADESVCRQRGGTSNITRTSAR